MLFYRVKTYWEKRGRCITFQKTVVAADISIAAETTFKTNLHSVTLVEPQSEVWEAKTSLLGTLEMKLCQTHMHIQELSISKVDTCLKNTAQVLPDILHPVS